MGLSRVTSCSHRSMDPIQPTATASREARRRAQQTLKEIDALLASDDTAVATVHHGRDRSLPGPGSYDLPSTSKTMWTRPAALTMHEQTRPKTKKTALVVRTNARETRTPGPGAYDVTAADRTVRPRIVSTMIRETPTQPRSQTTESRPLEDLDVARADVWLSRCRPLKGHVTYRHSVATDGLSKQKRGRLRMLRLERSRHTRVGFYSINYALTERRSVGHSIGAAKSQRGRHSHAELRRKLMNLTVADERMPKPKIEKDEKTTKVTKMGRAEQRVRATVKALSRKQDQRIKLENKHGKHSEAHDLVKGHMFEMARQHGRDDVQCRQKNRRIVAHFSSPPVRERSMAMVGSCTPPQSRGRPGVAFDKMLGRVDSLPVDARGVYMVGQEDDHRESHVVESDDRKLRPRVPVVTLRPPSEGKRKPHEYQLVLSPHYDVGRPRGTQGHLFLRLGNQLDREERARPKVFTPRTNL